MERESEGKHFNRWRSVSTCIPTGTWAALLLALFIFRDCVVDKKTRIVDK